MQVVAYADAALPVIAAKVIELAVLFAAVRDTLQAQ
jgi:hypothetical protein